MKKINAKPLDSYSTFEIDESKLKQMYYGSLDQCRCGCGGDYHKPGEPSSADQMKINAGFVLLYKSQDVVFSDFGDELYFEVESHIEEGNYDDYDDYDDDDYGNYDYPEEDKRIGYGFYFKK